MPIKKPEKVGYVFKRYIIPAEVCSVYRQHSGFHFSESFSFD